MDTDYQTFRRLLNEALKKMLFLYFKTPVAGKREEIVRERLFCYELYHQLRCAFDDDENFGYWIGGELDKDRHPIIRGDLKPDLVVHEPGDMDRNLCVLEVKPISGKKTGFQKDIITLTTFVTQYKYHAGILLVFGDAKHAEAVIKAKVGKDLDDLRRKHVYVMWVKHAQCSPVEI